MLANYINTANKQPTAGAQIYAFEPQFSLPAFSVLGPGIGPSYAWRVVGPESVYYNQGRYLQGLIGVVAGQLANQALLDTRGM